MPHSKLSRREALKTLAALTGAATLATLPDQWSTPVIETGVLPAHAQTSGPPSLSDLRTVVYQAGTLSCSGSEPYPVDILFAYQDPQGGIVPGAAFEVYEGNIFAFSDVLLDIDFEAGSDGFSGSVLIEYCLNYEPADLGIRLFSDTSGLDTGLVYGPVTTAEVTDAARKGTRRPAGK